MYYPCAKEISMKESFCFFIMSFVFLNSQIHFDFAVSH